MKKICYDCKSDAEWSVGSFVSCDSHVGNLLTVTVDASAQLIDEEGEEIYFE